MSTLWTPDGEHKPSTSPEPPRLVEETFDAGSVEEESLERLRAELASTDASEVIANHCYGLFELAAIYLSESPPKLEQATLSIDALSAIVEKCSGRLGVQEGAIRDALSQLQTAYLQISVLSDGEPDG